MRTITVTTDLDAPADRVWDAVRTPAAFVHVARGMLRYPAAEREVGPWQVGDELRGWTFLLGFVPFSVHRLRVAEVDAESRRLRSEEGGGLVRTWRHDIEVTPLGDHRCRYLDRIGIDAGPLTGLVVGFAHAFYRYRQRRWRRLAPVLAALPAADRSAMRRVS